MVQDEAVYMQHRECGHASEAGQVIWLWLEELKRVHLCEELKCLKSITIQDHRI